MLVKDETSTLTVQHNGFGIFTACKEQMCAEITTLNHKSTFHKKILKLCNQRVSVHEYKSDKNVLCTGETQTPT